MKEKLTISYKKLHEIMQQFQMRSHYHYQIYKCIGASLKVPLSVVMTSKVGLNQGDAYYIELNI